MTPAFGGQYSIQRVKAPVGLMGLLGNNLNSLISQTVKSQSATKR